MITRFANPDTSDSRKVSCLMAAFRKGHIKVVKYLVRQVRQFPSDTDCRRLINTITDKVNIFLINKFFCNVIKKDLLKKCQTCMDQIISAKERQAAEANKAANNLLKEIESEKSREQTKKEAAAKKREKRKAKKKGKQQTTTTDEPPVKEDEQQQQQPEVEEHIEIPLSTTVVVDDDLRLKMVKTDIEQKLPSPERTLKQPTNNKKKTNTMTRKIERHQENLVSKTKQDSSIVEDGWQEVIGKQKKITIPHEQYSRIIGRCGSNLNVLREVTGASIDVENKRAIGDKTILIK